MLHKHLFYYCKSFFNLAQFYEIRWPCAVSKGHDPCTHTIYRVKLLLVLEKGERVARDMPLEVGIPPANVNTKELLSPTYGKPTPDTHPLLNEEVAEPVDMILETRYVQSPQPKGTLTVN